MFFIDPYLYSDDPYLLCAWYPSLAAPLVMQDMIEAVDNPEKKPEVKLLYSKFYNGFLEFSRVILFFLHA